ncbi:MAG TPA: alpha-L-arabinofuranosidase C-terminal domain-containing protein, partial [Phycisphaerae bacterium]|nr:alpha-L-arabinofuranosidase C-terminal domain-containing protein [Phycisphaerae bacterium]
MTRLLLPLLLAATLAQTSPTSAPQTEIPLTLHTDTPIHHIDPRIYSQFLEHIFHSVHGGIWGDQILNPSLEILPPRPARNNQPAPAFTAPFDWETFGPATFANDPLNPQNSTLSLHITQGFTGNPPRPQPNAAPNPDPSGIRQHHIYIQQNESYTLTLFARSAITANATVALATPDNSPLFSAPLQNLSPDWKKFTFTFIPTAATPEATLSITLTGPGDLSLDQFSLFSKSALDTGGFRPDLLKAIDDLHPATIRWPGGSFANSYMWEYGVGPADDRRTSPVEAWSDRDPNQFGTDEFMRLCDQVHAQPLLVLNTRRGLQPNLDWLEYCLGDPSTKFGHQRAQNGHPAPYPLDVIEIDNEPWLLMDQPRYLDIVHRFSAAIRAKYPQLHLSVAGGYAFDTGPGEGIPANAHWDAAMLDNAARDFDILSPHYYNGLLDKLDYANNPRDFEKHLLDIGALIKKSANPNIKLYISEWNAQSTDWRTGLYAAGILNVFERNADLVEISCPALFLRSTSAKSWDNALINFNQSSWFPAPNYVVMKLWRDHYAPNLLQLDTPENSPLSAVASESDDKKTIYLKLVNPSDSPINLTTTLTGPFTPTSATLQLLAPGSPSARNTLQN